MDRDNYFLLLELSFDPIENDLQVISDSIIKFRQKCSRNKNHPTKGNMAKKHLGYINDIENTMKNAELRKIEANNAKKIAYEKLDKDLALICSKGSITNEEIEALKKSHNIDIKIIKKRITVPIKDSIQNVREEIKGLEVSIVKKIQHNLNIIKKENLYDFLEVTINTSPDLIIQKARAINAEVIKNSNKTAEVTARGELAGICIDIFKSQDKIKQYSVTMSETKLEKIDEMINVCANITKRLEKNQYRFIVNSAYELGIDNTTSEKRIIDYCKRNGITVDYSNSSESTADINKVKKCGVCGISNIITDKSIKMCSGCGSPLRINCPKCNTENDSSSYACVSCGYIVGNMLNAIKCIEKSKKALKDYRIREAEECLKEAEEYWPGYKEINLIRYKLNKLKSALKDNIDLLDSAISEKNFYKAREEFSKIVKKFSGYKNDILKNEIEDSIKDTENLVDKANKAVDELEKVELCISALNICSDCKAAQKLLEKFPPQAPSNFNIENDSNSIILRWNPSSSKGNIYYKIVKKIGSMPKNIFDGQVIDNIRNCYYEDNNIKNGIEYYFAVYAIRGGVSSNALINNNSITRLEEVSELEVIPDDKTITIKWNKPDNCDKVEVFRYENNTIGAKINRVFDGRLKEEGLTNNKKYSYFIRVKYTTKNKTLYSKGIIINSIPKEPAKPLLDYEVVNENNRYKITWSSSLGNNFEFYYSNSAVPFTNGSIQRKKEVQDKLSSVSIISKGMDNIIFNINSLKVFYIVPVTFSEDMAIIGKVKKISSVNDILNLNYKVNNVLEQIELEWKWPNNINEVLVTYNNLGFRENPDDESLTREMWSKKRYEENSSCIIKNINSGIYYFTIYGVDRSNGEVSYSTGENIKISGSGISNINYEIKTEKGLFGRIKGATISISADENITEIPMISIVGKMKTLPINKNDGEVIEKIDPIELKKGKRKLKISKDSIKQGMYLRVFFNDDNENKNYRLLATSKNQII